MQALVSVCREDCSAAGLQLMEVLVTVMAVSEASGLRDKVRHTRASCPATLILWKIRMSSVQLWAWRSGACMPGWQR